jgi:preprotein translocase subunit YajC
MRLLRGASPTPPTTVAEAGSAVDPNQLVLLALLIMVGLLLWRGSRQRRELATLQAGLTVGSRVLTTSGLHATLVGVDGETVTLETSPGHRSTWDRRAVLRVISPGPQPERTAPEPPGGPAAEREEN